MGGGAGRHTLGRPPTQNKAPGHGGGSSPLAPAVGPRPGCSSPPCPACAADNCVCSRIKAKGSAFICDNSSESRSPRVAPVGTTTGKPLLAATFANQLPGKKKKYLQHPQPPPSRRGERCFPSNRSPQRPPRAAPAPGLGPGRDVGRSRLY